MTSLQRALTAMFLFGMLLALSGCGVGVSRATLTGKWLGPNGTFLTLTKEGPITAILRVNSGPPLNQAIDIYGTWELVGDDQINFKVNSTTLASTRKDKPTLPFKILSLDKTTLRLKDEDGKEQTFTRDQR